MYGFSMNDVTDNQMISNIFCNSLNRNTYLYQIGMHGTRVRFSFSKNLHKFRKERKEKKDGGRKTLRELEEKFNNYGPAMRSCVYLLQ